MADSVISEASVKRYLLFASEKFIQDSLLASGIHTSENFKLLKTKDGVEVSRRSEKAKTTLRGRRIVSVSSSKFEKLVNAANISKHWDPKLVEGRCLQILQENLIILRLAFSAEAGPLLKNREFIVFERRETINDATFVVAIASLPQEMAAAILPQSSKVIRGLIESGWVIENLEQDDECMVTCTAQIDPRGWLPKWMVNILSVNLVTVIEDITKAANTSSSFGSQDS
eukprot:c18042_g1_i1 orf=719-1402(+)